MGKLKDKSKQKALRGQLKDELRSKMVESLFDKTQTSFLPQGAFDTIISRERIKEAIRSTDDALVDFICLKAPKLFAITAFRESRDRLRAVMSCFFKNNFQDKDLPMEKWSNDRYLKTLAEDIEHPFASMEENMEENVEDEDNRSWGYSNIYDLQRDQFKFLAPILSTDTPSQDTWGLIMPFIEKGVSYAEGSFGMISKYKIHPDHIQRPLNTVGRSTVDC